MKLPPLVSGRLVRRYKRFLADVVLDSGQEIDAAEIEGLEITAHCANPGAMLGLNAPGNRVYLSKSPDPKRKLPWSWQLVEADFGWIGPQLVGINTGLPNLLAAEAIADGTIRELAGYASCRREVKYGVNSRIDMLLQAEDRPPCYVEVKNVHLMRKPGLAEFPDCVTNRGAKHLDELANEAAKGNRAVMLFIVQMAAECFDLAHDIDPAYARGFERALASGVEALAYTCRISREEIAVAERIPIAGAD